MSHSFFKILYTYRYFDDASVCARLVFENFKLMSMLFWMKSMHVPDIMYISSKKVPVEPKGHVSKCLVSLTLCILFLIIHSVQSGVYYVRRGYKNPNEQPLYTQQDIFSCRKGSASCPANCLQAKSKFNAECFDPVEWNIRFNKSQYCTYRCGVYNFHGEGASTFLPEQDMCLLNTKVRSLLNDCMLLLNSESTEKGPLPILDLNSITYQSLKHNLVKKRCEVNISRQYIKDGLWKKISKDYISFYIRNRQLMWNATNASLYGGQIIQLQLKNCRKKNWPVNKSECIVFKAKGMYLFQTSMTTSTTELKPTVALSTYLHRSTSSKPVVATPAFKLTSSGPKTLPTPTTLTLESLHGAIFSTSTNYTEVSQTVMLNLTTVALSTYLHRSTSSKPVVATPAFKLTSSGPKKLPTPTTLTLESLHGAIFSTSTNYTEVSQTVMLNLTTVALSTYLHRSTSSKPVVATPAFRLTSSGPKTLEPTTSYPNSSYSGQDDSNIEGVTVGIVTTCVILIIASLVLAFVCKKRRNSKSKSKKDHISLKATKTSADNPVYGRKKNDIIALSPVPDQKPQVNEDYDNIEYDYTALDGVQVHVPEKQPVYQSLDRTNEKAPQRIYQSLMEDPSRNSVYASLNKTGNNAIPEEYSYNRLEHLAYNPPHSKGVPSEYTALQRPSGNDDYLEPGVNINDPKGTSQPVYNVLEEPKAKQARQDNDPMYNVLEDPDAIQTPQDSDPVYNVLEDPDANQVPINEPLYNILEDPDADYDNAPIENDQNHPASGQDNIAYSSTIDLNIPQTPSCPDYAVLEGPEDPGGSLPESTYQPLDIRAKDDGVYQPLDRTSRSIYQSLQQNDSTA